METVEKGYTEDVVARIKEQVKKVIVEQDEIMEYCLTALFAGGHVLLEGVPGLAKTLLVKTMSKAMNLDFKRIQFTPDLMPSDVLGTKIYNMNTKEFELKKGPIFSNFILADEINRTPPKTQAGLLESMGEETVSIDGEMLNVPSPFMVFATQNPVEYEGTYPLPEALMDRFLLKIKIDYPSKEAEEEVLLRHHKGFRNIDLDSAGLEAVCSEEDILKCRQEVQNIEVDESIIKYILEVVTSTRRHEYIEIGSSPRGGIAILQTAKAYAVIQGRDFVIPEDVKKVAIPALIHRIILKPEVEIEGVTTEQVINNILSQVKVPR